MLILIILASLIPGILAVVQYLDNDKKEIQNKKEKLAFNLKIDSLKTDNSDLKNEIKILSKDNANLSHQLTETAIKLNDEVVGNGDLDIELNTNKTSEFSFRFVNNSSLAVNNANIMVQNYNEIKKCEIIRETENQVHIKLDCYKDNFIKYSGVNFNPNSAFLDKNKIYYFTNEYMNFAIQIETRKKTIIYHIVYKIVEGDVVKSYRIYNLVDKKKIFISESNLLKLKDNYWAQNFYEKVLYTD